MGLIWGGVIYVFITIAVASFVGFILNKVGKKEFLGYGSWLFFSIAFMLFFSNRFRLESMLTSMDSGLAVLVFLIFCIHFLLWKTKLSKLKILNKNKNIPQNVLSIIIALVLIIVLVSIFLGPEFITDKVKLIHQTIFKPI